jgi:ABC-type transport system substrate-binding protein
MMSYDPSDKKDHYVVIAVKDYDTLCDTEWGPPLASFGWLVCRPGVIKDTYGHDARTPVTLCYPYYTQFIFTVREDAENFAAALNHGRFLREEQRS